MRSSIALILILLSGGCAFRSSQDDSPPPGGEGAGLEQTLPPATLRTAWWIDERTKAPVLTRPLQFVSAERLLRSGTAVTLPATVPDRLELELTVPTKLAEVTAENVVVNWVQDGTRTQTLAPKSVQVASSNEQVTVLLLELAGLRALLPDGTERVGQLRFLIQKPSGEVALTATQDVRTAPALLEFNQGAPASDDFEGLTENRVHIFELTGKRYDLIQVVRAKNLSMSPIALSVPIRGTLAVRAKRWRYVVQDAGSCGFSAWVEFPKVSLSEDARMFVLSDAVPRLAAQLSGAPDSLGATEITIAPGATARIGVYFTGTQIPALAEGHYEGAKPGKTRVVDHCESRCPHTRMGPNEFPLCWDAMFRRVGEQFGTHAQVQSCKDCSAGNQGACESCHAFEMARRTWEVAGPNCLFCGEIAGDVSDPAAILRGIPEWQTIQVFTDALVGDEDKSLNLESDPTSAPVRARFADARAEDDPETRALNFLKQAVELKVGQ